jgi:hypothetical protein
MIALPAQLRSLATVLSGVSALSAAVPISAAAPEVAHVEVHRPQRLALLDRPADRAPFPAADLRKPAAVSRSRGVRIVRGSAVDVAIHDTVAGFPMERGVLRGAGRRHAILPDVHRPWGAFPQPGRLNTDAGTRMAEEQPCADRPRFGFEAYTAARRNVLIISAASLARVDERSTLADPWLRTRVALPLGWTACAAPVCDLPAYVTWRRAGSVNARW